MRRLQRPVLGGFGRGVSRWPVVGVVGGSVDRYHRQGLNWRRRSRFSRSDGVDESREWRRKRDSRLFLLFFLFPHCDRLFGFGQLLFRKLLLACFAFLLQLPFFFLLSSVFELLLSHQELVLFFDKLDLSFPQLDLEFSRSFGLRFFVDEVFRDVDNLDVRILFSDRRKRRRRVRTNFCCRPLLRDPFRSMRRIMLSPFFRLSSSFDHHPPRRLGRSRIPRRSFSGRFGSPVVLTRFRFVS